MGDQGSFMHPHLEMALETRQKMLSSEEKTWVGKLTPGDRVEVVTLNTVYTLMIIDPGDSLVEATSNGEHIKAPERFHVIGPVVVGHRLFLEAIERDGSGMVKTVQTSQVREIRTKTKV